MIKIFNLKFSRKKLNNLKFQTTYGPRKTALVFENQPPEKYGNDKIYSITTLRIAVTQ